MKAEAFPFLPRALIPKSDLSLRSAAQFGVRRHVTAFPLEDVRNRGVPADHLILGAGIRMNFLLRLVGRVSPLRAGGWLAKSGAPGVTRPTFNRHSVTRS